MVAAVAIQRIAVVALLIEVDDSIPATKAEAWLAIAPTVRLNATDETTAISIVVPGIIAFLEWLRDASVPAHELPVAYARKWGRRDALPARIDLTVRAAAVGGGGVPVVALLAAVDEAVSTGEKSRIAFARFPAANTPLFDLAVVIATVEIG
jgi:hypothetical protein